MRIDHVYRPQLALDWAKVEVLQLDVVRTARLAELAPVVEGKPDVTKVSTIDLENLARQQRMQRIIFETARDVYHQMQKNWPASKESLLAQLLRLVEEFIQSDKLKIIPNSFEQDDLKRRLVIALNMTKVGSAYLGSDRASTCLVWRQRRGQRPWVTTDRALAGHTSTGQVSVHRASAGRFGKLGFSWN